jgi:hypothetical protein
MYGDMRQSSGTPNNATPYFSVLGLGPTSWDQCKKEDSFSCSRIICGYCLRQRHGTEPKSWPGRTNGTRSKLCQQTRHLNCHTLIFLSLLGTNASQCAMHQTIAINHAMSM